MNIIEHEIVKSVKYNFLHPEIERRLALATATGILALAFAYSAVNPNAIVHAAPPKQGGEVCCVKKDCPPEAKNLIIWPGYGACQNPDGTWSILSKGNYNKRVTGGATRETGSQEALFSQSSLPDYIYQGPESALFCAAITLDDCYQGVEMALDIATSEGIKLTFCPVGEVIEKNPPLWQRVVNEGHEICNHTYHHKDLLALLNQGKTEEVESEIALAQEALDKALGYHYPLRLLRPPYNAKNESLFAIAKKLGYSILTWNVNTDTLRQASGRSIILLHIQTDINLLKSTIDALQGKGLTLTTVTGLFSCSSSLPFQPTPEPPPPQATEQPVEVPPSQPPAEEPPPSGQESGVSQPVESSPSTTKPGGVPERNQSGDLSAIWIFVRGRNGEFIKKDGDYLMTAIGYIGRSGDWGYTGGQFTGNNGEKPVTFYLIRNASTGEERFTDTAP